MAACAAAMPDCPVANAASIMAACALHFAIAFIPSSFFYQRVKA
jgi:hypothetical protein